MYIHALSNMENDTEYVKGSDNWNVAPGYVNYEVLIPILNFGKYRRIARFGSESQESIILPEEIKNYNRLEALDRMVEELDILISASVIATKKDKEKFLTERENLDDLLTYRDGVASSAKDEMLKRMVLKIDEEFFNIYMKTLIDIKERVVRLANENNLIFPQSEIVTKKDIFERVTNRG